MSTVDLVFISLLALETIAICLVVYVIFKLLLGTSAQKTIEDELNQKRKDHEPHIRQSQATDDHPKRNS